MRSEDADPGVLNRAERSNGELTSSLHGAGAARPLIHWASSLGRQDNKNFCNVVATDTPGRSGAER
jgi:hypothetical protein